jgi:predicted lipoprotein with Yx(FWY)xxD motif
MFDGERAPTRTRTDRTSSPSSKASSPTSTSPNPESDEMFRKRSIPTFLSSGMVIAALALAACGHDNGKSTASGSSTTGSEANSAQAATVVVEKTNLGSILADGKDRTLYLFLRDSGTTSACNDACAAAWPPLIASGTPTAGGGAQASLVGTTKRSDGTSQVTYNGHPVYRYSGDQNPGDTAGQGLDAFGATWYVLSPAGDQVTSSSGGGHGY